MTRNFAAALAMALVLSAVPARADDIVFRHVTVVDVVVTLKRPVSSEPSRPGWPQTSS